MLKGPGSLRARPTVFGVTGLAVGLMLVVAGWASAAPATASISAIVSPAVPIDCSYYGTGAAPGAPSPTVVYNSNGTATVALDPTTCTASVYYFLSYYAADNIPPGYNRANYPE